MRYHKQCISVAQTFPISKLTSRQLIIFQYGNKSWRACETNFSYTLDRMVVIDMGRWFSLSGDGPTFEMAVTLADGQHSGNNPRWTSLQKIMLCFGAIISTTFFRNIGKTPEGSTPPYVSKSRGRPRNTEVQMGKE